HRRRDLDVFAIIRKCLVVSPRLQQDIQGLVKSLSGLADILPKASHFVRLIATSDAAHEAPVNKIVQHRDFFSQAQGLPDWQNYRRGTNPEALGTLPDVQRLHERCW